MDGNNQEPEWQYRPETEPIAPYVPNVLEPTSVASPPTGADGGITWTASEFIAHHKDASWYAAFAGCAALIAIAAWLISDVISAIYVLLGALVFAVFAGRQPRELTYRLDSKGLIIGGRQFAYPDFRSFSIMHEGAVANIVLVPMKRFGQLITIYYDSQDENKIIDLLSQYLPHEARKADPIDNLMWRIRF